MIREMQASEAKTRLLRILDDVERGDTVIITRRGRRIARLIPEVDGRKEEIHQALEDMRALRQRVGRVSLKELLSSIHEGHKY
ncbi:MAG: type II toxin-antitoxin system Phd/YefM family antitoxin [Candidatus Binataceae bacterium]